MLIDLKSKIKNDLGHFYWIKHGRRGIKISADCNTDFNQNDSAFTKFPDERPEAIQPSCCLSLYQRQFIIRIAIHNELKSIDEFKFNNWNLSIIHLLTYI